MTSQAWSAFGSVSSVQCYDKSSYSGSDPSKGCANTTEDFLDMLGLASSDVAVCVTRLGGGDSRIFNVPLQSNVFSLKQQVSAWLGLEASSLQLVSRNVYLL